MTLDDATTTVARITYKPDWHLRIADRPDGPALVVVHPHDYHQIPLPLVALRYMTTRQLVTWVFGQVRDLEARRAEREFAYAGQRVGQLEGP